MSAAADRLFDDYWFVLARSGRARGPGAAAAERPEPPAMRASLLNAVRRKPQVMVKITSFARSKEGLAAHLDYISRNGQNEVFDPAGERFSAIGEQMGLSARDALQHYGRELATGPIEEGANGRKKGRPRSRVSMNLMLSMPAGTDTGAFELAVRDFLNEQFQAHDRVFTFHDDRDHYHAHVVVGLQGHDGRWLNPRKGDLLAWRGSFAESLTRHGIVAEATPAYSRGKGKNGYRRDLEELRRRGTRERPDPSPGYEPETEERAIRRRADAWTRIAVHYAAAGDHEAADAIRDYVAYHFDYRPETEPGPSQAPRPDATPAPVPEPTRRKRPRGDGRER